MRAAVVLVALLTACGGKSPATHEPTDDDSESDQPFVTRGDFKPTSFSVDVKGEGTPIIFIPGLGCPGSMFDDVVEKLGDGYQTHVLTLAGFAGEKPIKPPLGLKVRKELLRYIRSHKLEGAIVVGHSYGGFIAYWLAETAPKDLLGGMVVIDAGPGLDADQEEARLLRNTWAQAGDDELPVQVKNVFSMMTANPKKMEPYYETIARSDRQTIGDAIFEYVKTDLTDDVDRIKVPSLIVLADGGLQGRYKQQVADIPHHEIVVLRGTKHFVWFDDLDGFTKTLEKFIRSTDAHHESASR